MAELLDGVGDRVAPLDSGPPVVVPDERAPLVRLSRLLDDDSLRATHEPDDIAVTTAHGRIDGIDVVAFCTDATRKGGALGLAECTRIADAIENALALRAPVIGMWHSGGAKLADGVEAMHGIGMIFAAMVEASGKIPQLSVVLGSAAGGAAYGPALTDLVIMAPAGRMFITGPDVVRSVTGEAIDMESLGGPAAHSEKSGVAHLAAASEADAYVQTRRAVEFLGRRGTFAASGMVPGADPRSLLPESPRRAYDVRPVVRAIVDDGDFLEIQPSWARNIVIGLGRLAGGTIGVVANNPLHKGGCLDSLSAEKAARFVRMCDAFGIPLLVVVDVPGYLPGVGQEWNGVVRRGAKLLYAFAEARVPRVTLVTRKSYGGAYIALNSRALGATAVYAWPDAEVAVMGAEAAVNILHRKRLAAAPEDGRDALRALLIAEHERESGGVSRGLALGAIDDVVESWLTRQRLAAAFAAAAGNRGRHGNVPL